MDRKQAAKRHFRRLIVESLEQRKMLTVPPPIDNNDTLALADPIQLYADVPFNVVDYIGNGSQASADVDVFRIS